MKISIITATFNSAKTIEDCIKSVKNQTHPDIEHIIIDGGSTDETLNILKKYKNHFSKIVSEADRGIYDALNKGIGLSTGEVIGILNSDDFYADNTVLSKVAQTLGNDTVDSCYANLIYVSSSDTNQIIRFWNSGEFSRNKFYQGWMPPHPTFFVKKSVYEKFGLFNLSLGTAADYEIMLRFLLKNKISTAYIPEIFVKMRMGGASNKSLKNRIQANYHDRAAWRVNGLKPRPWTLLFKPIRKIGQFFIK